MPQHRRARNQRPATVHLQQWRCLGGKGGGGRGGATPYIALFIEFARRARACVWPLMGARPRAQTFAEDLAALADGLGLRAFFVVGVSGGGPYALAAAAYLPPGRVRGVLTISSPAPAGAARPPARRGSGPGRRPGRAPRVTGAGAPPLQRLPAPQRRGPAMQGARHAGGR